MMKIMNALYERKINAMDKNIFIITFFKKKKIGWRVRTRKISPLVP